MCIEHVFLYDFLSFVFYLFTLCKHRHFLIERRGKTAFWLQKCTVCMCVCGVCVSECERGNNVNANKTSTQSFWQSLEVTRYNANTNHITRVQSEKIIWFCSYWFSPLQCTINNYTYKHQMVERRQHKYLINISIIIDSSHFLAYL